MALGSCRHCGFGGIPVDAPICRSCAGWRPNPGFLTRLGVTLRRVIAVVLCGFFGMLVILGATKDLIVAWIGLVILLPSSAMLFRAVFRPYGVPPAD